MTMRAMILAAGRGERMRPLTDELPKPLLCVGGRPLIHWHLQALARAGVRDVVVNLAWQGARLRESLGDGAAWGLRIHFSDEGEQALETGGGIFQALPQLGDAPFLVVNGDIWTDHDFARLPALPADATASLVLVPNPPQHLQGDFTLTPAPDGDGRLITETAGAVRHTFAGIGIYRPGFFAGCQAGSFALLPLLRRAIAARALRGTLYDGAWYDIGTPARLRELDQRLASGGIG